jgi:hypothetical protein
MDFIFPSNWLKGYITTWLSGGWMAFLSTVHKVDPLARQVGKRREVLGCREPLRLEAAHLARRSRTALSNHSRSTFNQNFMTFLTGRCCTDTTSACGVLQAEHSKNLFADHPKFARIEG